MSGSFDASESLGAETLVDGEQLPEAGPALAAGATVGRYAILAQVGEGAMGVVYAAYDPDLDRQVALKLLRFGGRDASNRRVRLLREAQALAKLSHPNVIAVHDVGTWRGQVFVAMEFVQGVTVAQWLEQARSLPEVMRVFMAAGRGLGAVHREGLVHRDFKPDNVMVGPGDRVRVMDFGLARGADESDGGRGSVAATAPDQSASAAQPTSASHEALATMAQRVRESATQGDTLGTPLTQTGAVMGTPAYMAPEQHLGEVAQPHSDQFAYCVALWEAVYKQRPFEGGDRVSLAVNVTQGTVREPSRELMRESGVPATVHAALRRGLQVNPAQRFEAMPALLAELARDPMGGRRARLAIIAFTAAVAVGAVGATLMAKRSVEAPDPCAEAAADLGAVWGPQRSAKIGEAFGKFDRAYTADTRARVGAAFEAWGQRWGGARTDACEDTLVRGQQSAARMDLRMDCLDERLRAVDAILTVFEAPDETVIARAVEVVADLPDVDQCADPTWFESPTEPPASAELVRVDAARDRIAEARALYVAGRYEPALALARELGVEAKGIAYAPLEVEVDKLLGDTESKSANYEEALTAYEAAFLRGWELGLDRIAAQALIAWVYVRGIRRGELDAVVEREALTSAMVARLGEPRLEAQLANVRGALAQRRENTSESVQHHQRALELWREIHGPRHLQVASALNNLGTSYDAAGDGEAAMAAYVEALGIWTETVGPEHPLVASCEHNIGSALNKHRKFREALVHFDRAAQIRLGALEPGHPSVAMTRVGQANAYAELGRLAEAREAYDATLVIFEERLGKEHGNVAAVLNNRGNINDMMGAYPEALADYQRAMDIRMKGAGEQSLLTASGWNNVAGVYRAQGAWAQALAADRRALKVQEALEPADSVELAYSTTGLARSLLGAGRHAEAKKMFERSAALIEPKLGADHEFMAYVYEGLGELALIERDAVEAKAQLRKAIDIRARAGARPDELAMAKQLMADALWALGEKEAARSLVRDAARSLEGTGYAPSVGERLRAWLAAHG